MQPDAPVVEDAHPPSTSNDVLPTPRTAQVLTLQAELAATQRALSEAQMLITLKDQDARAATALAQQVLDPASDPASLLLLLIREQILQMYWNLRSWSCWRCTLPFECAAASSSCSTTSSCIVQAGEGREVILA